MANWTSSKIPDLTGKTAIVTGANSGLGLHITEALADHGCEVILACRNLNKADQAAADIRSRNREALLETRQLDLADLDSVKAFADGVLADNKPLDLLINNAGVMACPEGRTAQGFELQFGTNHLGHFALTGWLLPALTRTTDSRVVALSSLAHLSGKIRFDDPNWNSGKYREWVAYCQSKLANLMFAQELDRRLKHARHDSIAVAAHPGYSDTNLQYAGPKLAHNAAGHALMKLANTLIAQSAEMGALPALYAATSETVRGGEYFGPRGWRELRGYPKPAHMSKKARNPQLTARLWALSEELTGVEYL